MFERVEALRDELHGVVARLEPVRIDALDAKWLVEAFAEMERLCAAGKTLAAGRVAGTKVWADCGDRSAAHWLARTSGTSLTAAVGALETARRLDDLPATDAAFRAGRLSTAQAEHVASGAAADPYAEGALLDAAVNSTVTGLREESRRVQAAASDDELDRYEAVRSSRSFRRWTDVDGAYCASLRTTPDDGALLDAVLENFREPIFRAARKADRREPYAAYDADALVAMARAAMPGAVSPGSASKSAPRAMIHFRVDYEAYRRGRTEPGEVSEIPALGPVPVATVRRYADDAIVDAVLADGAKVIAAAHVGRTIPAKVRTALDEMYSTCGAGICDVRDHLEIDHIEPFAEGGPTTLANLWKLCSWHHYLKTHQRYRVIDGPNGRDLVPPERCTERAPP
jgi:hypothetical protein